VEGARIEEAALAHVRADPAVRVLFESRQIVVGEFHCAPDDPRWSQENVTEEGHFVAFPGTSVVIQHAGSEPAVASRNEVVLYNPDQTYRRALLDPSGDHCAFLMLAPGLVGELAAAFGRAQDGGRGRFVSRVGPVAPATFLLHRLVVRALRRREAEALDRLRLEEALYRLVYEAACVGFRTGRPRRRTRRRQTAKAHALVVEETKALLARRFAERLTLADIAAAVLVSPFHLGRIFRERTGFGVHEYRDQLRLRLALERVLERDVRLCALAVELGYSSHSHFTDSFRRVFGVPPSAIHGSTRRLPELRRKLEAAPTNEMAMPASR
jgi:AraC family transcriptional regulator